MQSEENVMSDADCVNDLQAEEQEEQEEKEENQTECDLGEQRDNRETGSDESDEDDDEQIIVRGFGGNMVRTERGIQYLGKRLAKYVLSLSYPDQPHFPVKSSLSRTIARSFSTQWSTSSEGRTAHKHSSVQRLETDGESDRAYRITSISFIGHSLGGLTQTYAIAYIKKHSPEFFDTIKPINFIALASPFLGLSNENPIYVKFALDFGLVGRTGQDLGLTWRPPTMMRSGWGAMIGGLSNEQHKTKTHSDPGSKPLLRILPVGPAHAALKMFRNRSIYSNVVNDGIVPLRTSCLLFLDWRGLGRVEKARREEGLVETMVGWGWAEMTGQNTTSFRSSRLWFDSASENSRENNSKKETGGGQGHEQDVPQPQENATVEDDIATNQDTLEPESHQFLGNKVEVGDLDGGASVAKQEEAPNQSPGWGGGGGGGGGLLSFLKPQPQSKSPTSTPPKHAKIYHRSQTTRMDAGDGAGSEIRSSTSRRPDRMARGPSLYADDVHGNNVQAPPRTTFFESAGDVLKPPLPSRDFIIDPAARPQTIFHDRIYHPEDIPPPAAAREPRPLIGRSTMRESKLIKDSSSSVGDTNQHRNSSPTTAPAAEQYDSDMKVEEKIARAYHRDLSWRKVLVRLEPDAHNNMIVRRTFANAYGWPVIKHMCDTHFAFTATATEADATTSGKERVVVAGGFDQDDRRAGEQVEGQQDAPGFSVDQEDTEADAQPPVRAGPLKTETKRPSLAGKRRSTPNLERLATGKFGRSDSEMREATDKLADLDVVPTTSSTTTDSSQVSQRSSRRHTIGISRTGSAASNSTTTSTGTRTWLHARTDSARWSDRFFSDASEDDDSDVDYLKASWKTSSSSPPSSPQPQPQPQLRSQPSSPPAPSDGMTADRSNDNEPPNADNSRATTTSTSVMTNIAQSWRTLTAFRGVDIKTITSNSNSSSDRNFLNIPRTRLFSSARNLDGDDTSQDETSATAAEPPSGTSKAEISDFLSASNTGGTGSGGDTSTETATATHSGS